MPVFKEAGVATPPGMNNYHVDVNTILRDSCTLSEFLHIYMKTLRNVLAVITMLNGVGMYRELAFYVPEK